jgi:hypothetical protein
VTKYFTGLDFNIKQKLKKRTLSQNTKLAFCVLVNEEANITARVDEGVVYLMKQ